MASISLQQHEAEEANAPMMGSGAHEEGTGASTHTVGFHERHPHGCGRPGGRSLAAGAIAICLAGATLVSIGASGIPKKAALSAKTQLREDVKAGQKAHRSAKKDGKKNVIVPDMGQGFAEGTFWPTVFCWSVMNIHNQNEVNTIKMQLKHRIGIFACDNVAVLSAEKVFLGKGHSFNNGTKVDVHSWKNPAADAPVGNLAAGDHTNSVKNTGIFINAWNILVKSGALWGHNWTVKVDPDAVFFAERLRWHVKKYTYGSTPMYFKNCNFKGPQLYGALEVFNEAAMRQYAAKAAQCGSMPWGGWGEDEWIDKCMMSVGAQQQIDYALVGDHRCMSAECDDTWRAAFHDYKTPEAYLHCYKRSMGAVKWKKKQAKLAAKMKALGAYCCTSAGNPADKCGTCQASVHVGKGWCGSSAWTCKKCGAQTAWCQKGGKPLES